MNSLVQEIIKGLLPEEEGKRKVVAVYGGGFKPPTEGHFEVVKQALEENPEIDEFIIFIGTKDRDGLTKADALLIWEIYNKYLPYKVKIDPSDKSPIQSIYNYAKEHPEEEVLFVIGARENNEEDFKDIALRTKSMDKYPNLELRTIVTKTAASGTAARNAAKVSYEKFRPFLPAELTDEEAREVFDIVSQNIQEELRQLNENTSYGNVIDYKSKIVELTDFMRKKGYTIDPLPKIEFVNGDTENAKDFFGKTAYYDPNTMTVVLYTEGRHPKDIVRSFAHEMIHHVQNLEGRLGDITTTNTQEDDHLDKLEQEANLKGTMTFRNWTDSLNEAIVGNKIVCDNCGWSWNIKDGGDDLYICHKCGHDNTPIKENKISEIKYIKPNFSNEWEEAIRYPEFKDMGKEEWLKIASQGKPESFSKIKDILGNVDLDFETLEEPKKERFKQAFEKGVIEMSIAVKFGDKDYDLVAGNTRLSGLVKNGVDPKIWIVDISNIKENKTKDPFGINAYAMELGKLREEDPKYKIYLDMDGVVADFDKRFTDLAGMGPSEFEEKYGKNAFWDFIDEGDNKLVFWIGIPPMSDAKQLVDFVSNYDYEMLTAPSLKKQSVMGKGLWMKNQTNKGLFPFKPKVNYKSAKNKKDFAAPNHILIDDREDNINSWIAAGGIGILHTSASSTINQLKKLGL
jgi:DNA-binding Lrp family transcriptional regulator